MLLSRVARPILALLCTLNLRPITEFHTDATGVNRPFCTRVDISSDVQLTGKKSINKPTDFTQLFGLEPIQLRREILRFGDQKRTSNISTQSVWFLLWPHINVPTTP